MRARLWLVFVSVVLVAPAIEGAPPEPAVDTNRLDIAANMRVAVHVYTQGTELTAEDEQLALKVARDVFATASIDVAWTMCEPGTCLKPSAEALKVRIVLSPEAGGRPLRALLPDRGATALLVGPEGGFAAAEVEAARAAGFQAASLGSRILRVETAAIVAVALADEAFGAHSPGG